MYKYNLRERRHALGMTLEEVGKIVGVGKSTVRKWETGDIENMKRDKIALLAKALKITPGTLMGWETKEKNVEYGDLSESEIEKVKDFVEFLRTQRSKN